jgi:SLT domain-containing protein
MEARPVMQPQPSTFAAYIRRLEDDPPTPADQVAAAHRYIVARYAARLFDVPEVLVAPPAPEAEDGEAP